ncbi:MAG: signal recognition particle-docking protein FtsY [Actinomycetota bacterium]
MANTPGTSWTSRIKKALARSRESLSVPLDKVLSKPRLGEEVWEELEELLVAADTGMDTALAVITDTRRRALRQGIRDASKLRPLLAESIADIFKATAENIKQDAQEKKTLEVYILVGVNGSGKTTTAGKLAARFSGERSVVIAAADTFRAAAIEQLSVWAKRAGAELVKHQRGGDSAAVVFDAIKAANARDADVLIVDTAGRLHTKEPLMKELEKVKSVVGREAKGALVRTLLVIDATTGQNGLNQAQAFIEGVGVDGLILTKVDGTAKGGIVIGITRTLDVPVLFAGTGEGTDDLADFDADEFAQALVGVE